MSDQIPFGANPNFVSFVWREIAEIKEQEELGNYSTALYLALDLIKYLPAGIRESLNELVKNVKHELATNKPSYIHVGLAQKKKLLNELIIKLTDVMDNRGIYMERKTRKIPTNVDLLE